MNKENKKPLSITSITMDGKVFEVPREEIARASTWKEPTFEEIMDGISSLSKQIREGAGRKDIPTSYMTEVTFNKLKTMAEADGLDFEEIVSLYKIKVVEYCQND